MQRKFHYTDDAKRRIMRDLHDFHSSNLPGIFVESDENDIGRLLIFIIGPTETPYEGGFFFFELLFPEDYPYKPPAVEIRTTNNQNSFRFNPNFYVEGKVCLSILGTYPGEPWKSIMSLTTCLLCIQTRLNRLPLENEPGFESTAMKQKLNYNFAVQELTLRLSVCEQLQRLPRPIFHPHLSFRVFVPMMEDYFVKNFNRYLQLVDGLPHTTITTKFMNYTFTTNHAALKSKMESLFRSITRTTIPVIAPTIPVIAPVITPVIVENTNVATTSSTEEPPKRLPRIVPIIRKKE
jgi:ubiquitin-protein ligase